jgi:lactoylglutathione lyase
VHIEHVAIWTRDLEGLRAFYERWFGARSGERYERAEHGYSSYFLDLDDGARLELMAMSSIPDSRDDPLAQATGLVHFAISLGSEAAVDDVTAQLAANGIRVLDGPRRTGDGYYESTVLDPDGNRLELTV